MDDQSEFPLNDPRGRRPITGEPTKQQAALIIAAVKFHQENPTVYYLLVGACFDIIRHREHYGISPLWEQLRHWTRIQTTDPIFKLRNEYRAFYSRLLMYRFPEFDGLFVIKESAFDFVDFELIP